MAVTDSQRALLYCLLKHTCTAIHATRCFIFRDNHQFAARLRDGEIKKIGHIIQNCPIKY